MDYHNVKDGEIAKRIGEIIGLKNIGESNNAALYVKNGVWTLFDPCNNPADAWPIIIQNSIGVIPYKKGLSEAWNTATGLINGTTKDANPLRAAMIVFLMMQDAQ